MARIEFKAFVQGYDQQRQTCKDPKFEQVGQNNTPKLSFTTVETHRRPDGNGGFETTGRTFRNVAVWKELAVQFQNIAPGTRVEIIGREETRQFQKDDGTNGYFTDTTADFMRVIESRNQNGGGYNQQNNGYAPQNNGYAPQNNGYAPQGGGAQPNNNYAGNNVQQAQQTTQNAPQGGYQNQPLQNGGVDPWGQQGGGNYDWGAQDPNHPPF